MKKIIIPQVPYTGTMKCVNVPIWCISCYLRENNFPKLEATNILVEGTDIDVIISSEELSEEAEEFIFTGDWVNETDYAKYVDSDSLHFIKMKVDGHYYDLSY